MGSDGIIDASGVGEQKKRGMHIRDLCEATSGRRIAIDISIPLHKTVNGGITNDLEVAREIAEALHVDPEPDDLPDVVYLAVEKNVVALAKWIREDLKAVPVVVFDGAVPFAKRAEKAQREAKCKLAFSKARAATDPKERLKHYRAAVFVTWKMMQYAASVCRREGIEIVVSLTEADHQLALMSIMGDIDIVLSEDSDLIVLGARRVLYGSMRGRGVNGNRYDVALYDRDSLFRKHVCRIPRRGTDGSALTDVDGNEMHTLHTYNWEGLVQDHIILFAALCKCDYGKMITGVGRVKATQIVEKLAPAFPRGFSGDVESWADKFKSELCRCYKEVMKKPLEGMYNMCCGLAISNSSTYQCAIARPVQRRGYLCGFLDICVKARHTCFYLYDTHTLMCAHTIKKSRAGASLNQAWETFERCLHGFKSQWVYPTKGPKAYTPMRLGECSEAGWTVPGMNTIFGVLMVCLFFLQLFDACTHILARMDLCLKLTSLQLTLPTGLH
jgi:5'-3' exonuclease